MESNRNNMLVNYVNWFMTVEGLGYKDALQAAEELIYYYKYKDAPSPAQIKIWYSNREHSA